MKLRTSLCNPTALKKDLTRFAPTWVLYTVGLFMLLTVTMMDDSEYYRASNLANALSFMAAMNLGYGFLNGQLLFGDLFNARHCNALHAMPLRRECWFGTHAAAGLLMAFVPNALMALVSLPMLGAGWPVALWWLLAVDLQYLFFFGLAACSALCVGNRFAMLLVYGIVNFFALIVYWFFDTMYLPLLEGVFVTEEPFVRWCPVYRMIDSQDAILVERRTVELGHYSEFYVNSVAPGQGWGYLAVCAVLGVALLGIALLLYRRRKLESAGDFMAVRALEPVFLVLYTLSMAAGFQVFADLFGTNEYVFLTLGLAIGFFTGRMLLMRTTRVFQLRGFVWFGVLALAFAASMLLTWLDPMGVTRYIPDENEIQGVLLTNHYDPHYSSDPMLTEEADIRLVRQFHQLALGSGGESENPLDEEYYTTFSLIYRLESGVTVTRRYQVAGSSEANRLAATLFTRPEYVLGTGDVEEIVNRVEYVYYNSEKYNENGSYGELYGNHTNDDYIRGLVNAILADCAEGTMGQNSSFHPYVDVYGWVEFSLGDQADGYYEYRNITIFEDNRHTIAYLEENPFPTMKEYE